jgi:hypothetical protein
MLETGGIPINKFRGFKPYGRRQKIYFLPPASCLLPPASCLLPPASCLLPPASYLLPPTSLNSFYAIRASTLFLLYI